MNTIKNKFVYAALLLVQFYLPRTCFSQNIDLCNKAVNSSKIVVAGGSITEILFLLEKQKQIVALDVTSNYPNETKNYPSIGYVRNLSTEGVMSMSPELILAEDDIGPPSVVNQIKSLGIDFRIIEEEASSDGVIKKIRCVSKIVDKEKEAEKIINNQFKPQIKKLEKNRKKIESKKIKGMLVLSMRGTSPIIAGGNTSGDSYMDMVGLENIFKDVDGWKSITIESIIELNPDYVIFPNKEMHKSSDVNNLKENPFFKNTKAGKNNNFIYDDGMAVLGFGPRTISSALNTTKKILDF